MTNQEFQALMAAAQIEVCLLALLVVVGDIVLVLVERRLGTRIVRRYLAAVAVAIMVSSLFAETWHPHATRIERPRARPSILRAAGYQPYCEGWWWYTDALCWLGEL